MVDISAAMRAAARLGYYKLARVAVRGGEVPVPDL